MTIDTGDPAGLARFYAGLLGMEVTYDGSEGSMIAGGGKSVMFQRVEGYTRPQWPDPAHPQQAHLDINVADLDTGQARAVELGATRLKQGAANYRVFTDPDGHPFCLTL